MAKQVGPIYVTGTFGETTFYELDRTFYARAKSSLDGKRVKREKAFARTMWHAGRFGRASKFASAAYQLLSTEQKDIHLYWEWMGIATSMLYAGKNEKEVGELLLGKAEKILDSP